MKILICEDQELVRQAIFQCLSPFGDIKLAASKEEASRLSQYENYDLYLIDLDLEYELAGLDFLSSLRDKSGEKVLLTGHHDDELIEKAFQMGADGYFTKPLRPRELIDFIKRLQKDCFDVSWELLRDQSTILEKDFPLLKLSVETDEPILLTGLSGTGKTRLAKLIHDSSTRKDGPFVSLNCSSFTESLLESTLFGHEKGAFTGADRSVVGKLLSANGGTLFLDEVSTMSMSLQTRLLKVLEEKTFSPLGSNQSITSDFRVISATCDDLNRLVEQSNFRSDLFFRLSGIELRLPTIKENEKHFKGLIKKELKCGMKRYHLTEEALDKILRYSWPGNYREFYREMRLIKAQSKGVITARHLGDKFHQELSLKGTDLLTEQLTQRALENGLKNLLGEIEREVVTYTLKANEGKVRQTLKDLKISSQALYRNLDHGKKRSHLQGL